MKGTPHGRSIAREACLVEFDLELVHSRQTIVIHFISAMLEIEALQHLVVDLFLVARVVGSAVLPARLYSSLNNQTRTLVARRECDAQLGNR